MKKQDYCERKSNSVVFILNSIALLLLSITDSLLSQFTMCFKMYAFALEQHPRAFLEERKRYSSVAILKKPKIKQAEI